MPRFNEQNGRRMGKSGQQISTFRDSEFHQKLEQAKEFYDRHSEFNGFYEAIEACVKTRMNQGIFKEHTQKSRIIDQFKAVVSGPMIMAYILNKLHEKKLSVKEMNDFKEYLPEFLK